MFLVSQPVMIAAFLVARRGRGWAVLPAFAAGTALFLLYLLKGVAAWRGVPADGGF